MHLETREWTNEVGLTPPSERRSNDYLYLLSKGVTPEQRKKFDAGDIFINGAVCKKCNDFVRSVNRHDFRQCSCGAVSVDGGSWYARRVGNPDDYINVIENFTHLHNDDD